MKIELKQGCICDSFTADGVQFVNMSDEKLKDILVKVAKHIALRGELNEGQKCSLQNIIAGMVESFPDDCEFSDHPCECCGDHVETYTMYTS